MARSDYFEELNRLKKDTLRMGELAKQAAENAVRALVKRNAELASEVIRGNIVIDELEFDLENRCMKLLALQHPLASDLRAIGTILKIITDLDRISDLAGDIANIVLKIADEPFVKPLVDIPRMSETAQGMIEDGLNAFSTGNIKNLMNFSERDDLVDALCDQVRRELITIMIENPRTIRNASHLLFVALHLERIADHACNIASRIYYMVTGERRKFE
ncbi:phosphate signaling complex protein PhoU [Candidatus Alkanophaga liquidiphilum]|nr:Phosphate uptake regulator PhoU [Candidatus Alkanophaga liquidiphilum]